MSEEYEAKLGIFTDSEPEYEQELYCNALSIRGVFSQTPLSETSIVDMMRVPEPNTPIRMIKMKTKSEANAWTFRVSAEAERFRKLITDYVVEGKERTELGGGDRDFINHVVEYIL
jgi:hypothetical protein